MRDYIKHFKKELSISAPADLIFNFADKHENFSSHMSSSSWMMFGGKMDILMDEGRGQEIGSNIVLKGKVLGVNLFLTETVTRRDSPQIKEWETKGDIRLLIIGHYRMGFKITPNSVGSNFKVYIDYSLPDSVWTKWLGYILGPLYARWCVYQMTQGVENHFKINVS